jgi:hypothetical protein
VTLALLASLGGLFFFTLADGLRLRSLRERALHGTVSLAARLGLTDLCLFTEARYTRHPSQADLHGPFQDHPAGREHFPSGSVMPPPRELTAPHANLDRKTEIPD